MQLTNEILIATISALVGAIGSYFAQNKQDEKINLMSRLSKLEMQVNEVENYTIQLGGKVQSLEGSLLRVESDFAEIKADIKEIRQEMKQERQEIKQELKSAVSEIKAEIKK